MPLLIPDRKNRRSRGETAGRRRGGEFGGGIWRLLACTEGSRDTGGEEEEEEENGGDAWATRHRVAIGRQERRRPRQNKVIERKRNGRWRHQYSGASADEATAASSGGGSSADHRRRPTRSSDRRDRGLRLRRPRPPIGAGDVAGSQRRRQTSGAGALAGSSSVAGQPRRAAGSPRNGGRRRRKRLVVAMLDDGDDDDRATPGRHQGRANTIKLRTTRNERSIRRILQELSVTLDAADSRVLPDFATVEIPSSSAQRSPQKSPAVAATSNTMTMLPSPQAVRTSPPPPPPPLRYMAQPLPPPPPPSRPPPTHPPPHAVPSASRAKAEPAIANLARQQQQQQQQQSNQQQQELLEQVQKADFAISQGVRPTMEETVRGNGRRGYRLFRRVFSAADNYYAVPFPPLETIKLNDDDDQWEDLEIYVASHKGMVAIKPKAGKQQQKKQSEASGVRRPSKEKLTAASGIPRPIADPARKEPLRPPKKQPLPLQPTPSIGAAAGGDQLAKRASLQPQQEQQTLKPPPVQPPPSRSARAGPLETPTRRFGYKQQQQTQQQQTRQRRADPLSPSRLLSQLRQAEPAGRPTMLTPPPSMGNARASQLPRCRWEPAATTGGNPPTTTASGGSRYGKLSAKLPTGAGMHRR